MKKIIKNISFLLFIMLIGSCGILDKEPIDGVSTEDLFKTADGIRSARLGLYSILGQQNYYGGYFPLMIDAHSDNGSTGGYVIESLNELGEKRLTPANLYNERLWVAMYSAVNSANRILENIDKITDFSAAEHDNIRGEALFVRALAHFDALRTWGEHWDLTSEYGIPLALKTQEITDVLPRATVSDTYNTIIADLTAAENLISEDFGPSEDNAKKNIYITTDAVKALLARVYQYKKDYDNAAQYAAQIMDTGNYVFFDKSAFEKLYTDRETKESIFELKYDVQNRSAYNSLTYKRDDASRQDLSFMVAADLDSFFLNRKNDVRAQTVLFKGNDVTIAPDGRSQKYRGEDKQDNPAYILRYAEMLLILAEAKGRVSGLSYLNQVRTARGLNAIKIADIATDEDYEQILLDERRAELNMEGHRFFDLAHFGKVKAVLGNDVKSNFPIPLREIEATKGVVKQNQGY